MWHQSGSTGFGITWQKAEEWVEKLNKSGYAGFRNWRLPTLEEAASLLKPAKEGSVLISVDTIPIKLTKESTKDKVFICQQCHLIQNSP